MYELQRTQRIPATAEAVWNFIATPKNLGDITPGHMGFELTSAGLPEKMYAGMFICYNIRPLLGIKIRWVTEITQIKEPNYFVDEQRKGPYRVWHHQHLLRVIEGGIEMTDIVHYQPPLGILGRLANSLFLRKQLKEIFDYRFTRIEERFGVFPFFP
jgi:ligand-binding SRPBCC domain-containing protein